MDYVFLYSNRFYLVLISLEDVWNQVIIIFFYNFAWMRGNFKITRYLKIGFNKEYLFFIRLINFFRPVYMQLTLICRECYTGADKIIINILESKVKLLF